MNTAPVQTRYTPEDLLRMPDSKGYELVDGQLVELNVSTWSSYVAGVIFGILREHCLANRLGWILPPETSFQCFQQAPDMVRKPDVAFIQLGRLSVQQAAAGHCPVVPDLAVEVLSPNDVAYEVDAKVRLYLDAGVGLVWVVNPEQRTVEVHRPTSLGSILREQDELTGEDVVPGFRCRVGEFFEPPPGASAAPTSP
ncbi:MAG TPA: Uma2 family endonuclease [Gemmataceae bacterium]|nr:Uma2 family endonuclease [Gemmataceae bacterium]